MPGCYYWHSPYSDRSMTASAVKKKLILDLVEAFMSANIPLDKLDNT